MFQALKAYLQDKIDDADADFTKNVYIGLAATGLILGMFFYYRHVTYRTYHRHPLPVAASQAAPANPAPAPVAAPAPQPELAATAPAAEVSSNSMATKDTGGSLGDSMMSAPASAPTFQSAFQQSAKTMSGSAAVPASRMPFESQAPARPEAPLTDEQKLLKTAQDSLDRVIEMAGKNPDTFGFAPGDKRDLARLGEPIRVYRVSDDGRKRYELGQPLTPLLQPTKEWIFPVMLDDRICFMLSVRGTGNEYVAGTSSRALAMVYEKIQERWPASQGYHPRLVTNSNMANYYFTIPELPEPNLTDTVDMFQNNPTLSPASVILASWR